MNRIRSIAALLMLQVAALLLAPGETYLNRIVYDFSTDRDATPRR